MEGDNSWASGVYKTGDAGQTWSMLPATKGLAVWSLALWPENPDVVAAGTATGIFLSKDAGETWSRISPETDSELRPVVSLAFDPTSSKVLYAGTTHLPWRTTDGGANWESIHSGMIDDSDVFSIQVDPRNPARVFASACSGVYGSSTSGELWKRLETPKGAFRTHFVAMDPKHVDNVFAGTTEGLLKSTDGGAIWKRVSLESVKAIAFDSSEPGRIFFASPTAGLLVSTDGGNTLREVNYGFTNRNFTTLTGSGNQIYSSSVYEASAGIYRTDNQGLRWTHASAPGGDQVLELTAAPDNPLRVFSAGYHSIHESPDGGKTWVPRKSPSEGRVTGLLALPGGSVLSSTDQGVFRSVNGGMTWTKTSGERLDALHATGRRIAALGPKAAYTSMDAGATWKRCGDPQPGSAWYGLDFDSASAGTALAATPSGVFRSTDGCATWSPVRGGLTGDTAGVVAFHPTHPGEAYVSQGGKVFRSTDGGESWLPLGAEGQNHSGPSALLVLTAARTGFLLCFRDAAYFQLLPRRIHFND